MGEKIDPKVIKKTQDALGKIIKKPPLTDKLLSKPPFRFLHDICTAVIKHTGLMKGLFTESEMNSENVKDKESKIAFLQKAIDLVSLITGKPLAAKPSKIVAGHEPERTNEFLQGIAEAVNKKVDNDEYVKRVLTGAKGGSEKPEKKSKEVREKSAEKHRKEEKSKEEFKDRERSKDRDKDKDRERRHRERKDKDSERSRDKDRSRDRDKAQDEKKERTKDREEKEDRTRDKDDRHKDREDRHRDREDRHRDREDRHRDREDRHRDKDERRDRERRKHADESEKEKQEENASHMNGDAEAESDAPARLPRPTSAKGSRRRQQHGRKQHEKDTNEDEDTSHQVSTSQMNGHAKEDALPAPVQTSKRMARPSSARPAPPRVKKVDAPPEEAPMAGNVPNIITDKSGGDSDMEDDMFVAKEEEEPQPEPAAVQITRAADSDSEDEQAGDHGGLVKKMMEAKAQLENGSQSKEGQSLKKTEIERSSQVSDVQRRKERELIKREIEKLRASIQTLTRSVNPLGKILDFVQEDMDSMQKELDIWKKENRENQVALQREQSITDSSVEPLRAHLGELDNAIKDQLDLIAAVKSNVMKNDDKISKMLGSITKS